VPLRFGGVARVTVNKIQQSKNYGIGGGGSSCGRRFESYPIPQFMASESMKDRDMKK